MFSLLAFQKRLPRDTVVRVVDHSAGHLPRDRVGVQRRWPRRGGDRRRRRVRRWRVRHRVHADPGDVTDELRGPDVRHALRRRAPLPAALADGLAAVRRSLRVAVQPGCGRAAHHARRVQLRVPGRAARALGRCRPHGRVRPLRAPRAAGDARARGRAPPSLERSPVTAPQAQATRAICCRARTRRPRRRATPPPAAEASG